MKWMNTVLLLIFIPQLSHAESRAEAYQKYIDRMIPLSFDFAKVHAGLQEHEVFLNLVSLSEKELTEYSVEIMNAQETAKQIMAQVPQGYTFEMCPRRSDGSIANSSLFENFATAARLRKQLDQAEAHLDHYSNIRKGLDTACDSGFEHIKFNTSDFSVLAPEVSALDGAYVSMGDPFKALLDLGTSIYNLFSNQSEQKTIEDVQTKFESQRAHDSDLQRFAKASCQEERTSANDAFHSFDQYYEQARNTWLALKSLPWTNLEHFWESCLRTDEAQSVQTWVQQTAQEMASNQQNNTSEIADQIRLRREIVATLSSLSKPLCPPGIRLQLRGLRAAATILGVEDPSLISDLNSAIDRVTEKCDGDAL